MSRLVIDREGFSQAVAKIFLLRKNSSQPGWKEPKATIFVPNNDHVRGNSQPNTVTMLYYSLFGNNISKSILIFSEKELRILIDNEMLRELEELPKEVEGYKISYRGFEQSKNLMSPYYDFEDEIKTVKALGEACVVKKKCPEGVSAFGSTFMEQWVNTVGITQETNDRWSKHVIDELEKDLIILTKYQQVCLGVAFKYAMSLVENIKYQIRATRATRTHEDIVDAAIEVWEQNLMSTANSVPILEKAYICSGKNYTFSAKDSGGKKKKESSLDRKGTILCHVMVQYNRLNAQVWRTFITSEAPEHFLGRLEDTIKFYGLALEKFAIGASLRTVTGGKGRKNIYETLVTEIEAKAKKTQDSPRMGRQMIGQGTGFRPHNKAIVQANERPSGKYDSCVENMALTIDLGIVFTDAGKKVPFYISNPAIVKQGGAKIIAEFDETLPGLLRFLSDEPDVKPVVTEKLEGPVDLTGHNEPAIPGPSSECLGDKPKKSRIPLANRPRVPTAQPAASVEESQPENSQAEAKKKHYCRGKLH